MRKTHTDIIVEEIIQFEPWCQKWKDWHKNGRKIEDRPDKKYLKEKYRVDEDEFMEKIKREESEFMNSYQDSQMGW